MAHKKKAVSSQSERKLSRRGFMIGASSTGLLGLLSLRLLYVQGLDPQNLAATSRDSRTRTQKVPAVRGQITDVNGHVLARSVQRYNIIADQTIVAEFKTLRPLPRACDSHPHRAGVRGHRYFAHRGPDHHR